ncbi:hypothetical protein C8Q76DRAFT_713679 [Earliella scabrosa]|nr:hypothetical protein C8Q76DRAFT_713679 [Earliella scabrosa]
MHTPSLLAFALAAMSGTAISPLVPRCTTPSSKDPGVVATRTAMADPAQFSDSGPFEFSKIWNLAAARTTSCSCRHAWQLECHKTGLRVHA